MSFLGEFVMEHNQKVEQNVLNIKKRNLKKLSVQDYFFILFIYYSIRYSDDKSDRKTM